MVQTTETNVIRPTITADDPLRVLCQHIPTVVDTLQQGLAAPFLFEQWADRCVVLVRCLGVVKLLQPAGECFRELWGQVSTPIQCCSHLVLHLCPALDTGQSHPEPKFRVVLEQRPAPSWATPISRICGIRIGGRRASPDRRAPRSVGNHQPLAEKLRQKLDVRSLSTSSTGTRELQQRGLKLRALHRELVRRVLFDRLGHRKLPPRSPLLSVCVVFSHEQ
mmetsp:Transcript_29111/g.69895  ORF Transcript_29111/g.69895 Transcript_29111/m.69895 type:complete len:221 (-) Transcript_29111:1046-1708(-)